MARRRLEAELEAAASDFLALDGWRSLKTDPVSDRSRGKGFGELGMADRLYIRYHNPVVPCGWAQQDAEVIWIEWKSPTGMLKTHQYQWHMSERARGAKTLVAGHDFKADYDSFVAWYRASGLLRRAGL